MQDIYTHLEDNENFNSINGAKPGIWSRFDGVASKTYGIPFSRAHYGMAKTGSKPVRPSHLALFDELPYLVLEKPFVLSRRKI